MMTHSFLPQNIALVNLIVSSQVMDASDEASMLIACQSYSDHDTEKLSLMWIFVDFTSTLEDKVFPLIVGINVYVCVLYV